MTCRQVLFLYKYFPKTRSDNTFKIAVKFQNMFFQGNSIARRRSKQGKVESESIRTILQILPPEDLSSSIYKVRISNPDHSDGDEVLSLGPKSRLCLIGAFRPSGVTMSWVSGCLNITGRPPGPFLGQGCHVTAYSFLRKSLEQLGSRGDVQEMCRVICRVAALLLDMTHLAAKQEAFRNDSKYRYSKQALENQLLNVSTASGNKGLVEQLANIALVYFQRIPEISVDVKSILKLDLPQNEDHNTTKSAYKSIDFIDFPAIVVSAAHGFEDACSTVQRKKFFERMKKMLATHLFLCPHGLENLNGDNQEINISDFIKDIAKSVSGPKVRREGRATVVSEGVQREAQ
eukprot:750480-Hanusia_phi.AAC.3